MNRSKASLALLEQSVMILVFALAAALCLRAFLWSDQAARDNSARDMAIVQAQNGAERLKASGGALLEDGSWTLYFDDQWQPAQEGAAYRLTALEEPAQPGLGRAALTVAPQGGDPLVTLDVAWQEVTP